LWKKRFTTGHGSGFRVSIEVLVLTSNLGCYWMRLSKLFKDLIRDALVPVYLGER